MSATPPQHGLSIRRIIGYTVVVLATLALLFVVYRLGQVVLLFILSVIFAAALRKGVVALENRGIGRGLAILFWYLVVLVVLGLLIFLIGGRLGQELQAVSEQFPRQYDSWLGRLRAIEGSWQQTIARRLPTTEAVIQGLGEGGGAEIGFQIAGLTTSILNVVVSLVAVMTLAFYWLIDQDRFERLWLTLLPVQQRAVARHTWRGIEYRVGAYVRSEAAQFVLTVVILWSAFKLLGITDRAMYAIYAGLVQLIPWIGIPLTLLPLGLMLFSSPWWQILAAAAVIIAVGAIMDQVIEPRLRGDAVVHPILTVVALMLLGEASGILGMLIALPLAATLQIVLSELVHLSVAPKSMTVTMEATQIEELRARIAALHRQLPTDHEHRREAEGLLSRLTTLMERTEEVVSERAVAGPPPTRASARRRLPAILQRRGS
jgi:putative permease